MFDSRLKIENEGALLHIASLNRIAGLVRTPIATQDGLFFFVIVYREKTREYIVQKYETKNLKLIWDAAIPNGGYGCPALTESLVIVLSNFSDVVAIDQASGEIRWRFCTTARVRSPVSVDSGSILFSSGGTLYSLSSDGSVQWTIESPNTFFFGKIEIHKHQILSLATVSQVENAGHVYLLNFSLDGLPKWKTDLGEGPIISSDASGFLVTRNDRIWTGAPTSIKQLDAVTGQVLKSFRTDGSSGRQLITSDGINGYWSTLRGEVGAFTIEEGEVLWRRKFSGPITTPISTGSNSVYFAADGWLYRLSKTAGDALDRQAIGHSPYSALTYANDGSLLIGGGEPPYDGLLFRFVFDSRVDHSIKIDSFFSKTTIDSDVALLKINVKSKKCRVVEVKAFTSIISEIHALFLKKVVPEGYSAEIPLKDTLVKGEYCVPVEIHLADGTVHHHVALLELESSSQLPSSCLIRDIPDIKQEAPNLSGAAIAQSLLSRYGDKRRSQTDIREMIDFVLKKSDYEPFNVWRLILRRVLMTSANNYQNLPEFGRE
ncbi:PQQ-binding-like beta-propeller repeat protein [Burkholderia sp. AU30198]|uniref:outer membrane protein assembly factor BamB family protein n=1 Tax=Burkholderia sp. AU30198 TaxID=2879627 RepID=UPI001CF174A0|nr:PQQ-binding-like beta-propeller repeat protein [Burkholderia sp. AU30198]MCA8292779.1 PQQ-binding-like beta-propeller repeat protein [Burkholderia sp. AU30198]